MCVFHCEFIAFTNLYSVELDFELTGRWEAPHERQRPLIKLWIHLMDLTSEDRHNMQLEPKHIPTPTINDRLSSSFCFPPEAELA